MVSKDKRTEFLKGNHIFYGFSEDQLAAIAEDLEEVVFSKGDTVYEMGDKADTFLIIYSGTVSTTEKKGFVSENLSLVAGDYFGLEVLTSREHRESSVTAQSDCVLFGFGREQIKNLQETTSYFKNWMKTVLHSRQLMEKKRFNWLKPDETIYLLTQKDRVHLYEMLIGPITALLIPAILLFLWMISLSTIPAIVGITTFLLNILWIIWVVVDWGNDYYVITNRRVIWLEKVIGLYESRQESPLSTILPVSIETGALGRIFDFGNVVIRTYTSRIVLKHVEHPYQIAAMIEYYRKRVQEVRRGAEVEKMKSAIRMKLGLEQSPPEEASPDPEEAEKTPPLWRLLLANLFRLRTEEGGSIVYRRHWYLLLQDAGIPTLLILLDFYLMGLNLVKDFGQTKSTMVLVLLLVLLGLMLWWIYQFVDWRNDRFEVTPEQIIDIDKKPLGLEQRKSAKLEDILSIEYRRVGVMGILLNFGTVYIMVGNTEFTFNDVHDPAMVQSEVEDRRNIRIIQKRELEVSVERERVADWLATYHRSANELRELEDLPDIDTPLE
ncbi:MAG: cyclic nucleotide-binding domain-containing protein [Anaerolineales bacterium]|nr:cyclic nucleotide-binding domain-containing protein [Anaerolineales bacterium]